MPSKRQILELIAQEAEPIHRNEIAKKLGEPSYRSFQTQLSRFEKQGLIDGTPDYKYSITELGQDELSKETLDFEEVNEEKLGTTDYQRFMHYGRMHGVSPDNLVVLTAEHVWSGGDFKDLDWVAKAFQEMGIRQDLRNRWWHSWRSYLNQPIPTSLPPSITEGEAKGDDSKVAIKANVRTHILDADDKPVFVGEGLGDMSQAEATELSKIRAARGNRTPAGTPQTPGSMADEMVKMFNAFQTFMGDRAEGKSWIMRQGEDGNMQIEEAEPGRPMIINYPQGNKPQPTMMITPEGDLQEVQPGQPIIIKQPAPPQQSTGVQYLVDNRTGQVTPVQPGQPIVIQAQPPQQQTPYAPIEMKDKDGNPMVLDLSTFTRLEEHRDKQRRDQESHETKMEIAKSFKDLISKASSAVGHIGEGK